MTEKKLSEMPGDEKLRGIPFVYVTGHTILRPATPLESHGLDFMASKVPFERILHVVNDLPPGGTGPGGDPFTTHIA